MPIPEKEPWQADHRGIRIHRRKKSGETQFYCAVNGRELVADSMGFLLAKIDIELARKQT